MADNVPITAGSGTTIATDDIAGVHYQRVKLVDGTLDATGAIGGDATNGLDVDVTRLPALVAGSANIGDVDVLTVPAPLSTTGAGTEAAALRVTMASDSTGLLSVDDNGGSLTVDTNAEANIAVGTAPAKQLVVGAVYNTTAPVPTNGQTMALQVDGAGNLNVTQGVVLKALAAQTTTLNAAQTIYSGEGYGAVLVQLTQTTTLTAGAVTFEVSYDGSTFVAMSAASVLDPTSATFAAIALPYTVQASTNKYFMLLTEGAQALRIRTSTAITGTGTVTPNYALLNYEPVQHVLAFNPTAANFKVDASGVAVPVTDNAGSLTVDAPVATPVFVRLSDGAAAISALPITDNAGSVTVDAPVGTPLFSTPTPSTTGGWSKWSTPNNNANAALVATAGAVSITASAATFGGYYVFNGHSATVYLQVFDANASVTLGTTRPNLVFGVPAGSAANLEIGNGVNMASGIRVAATTTASGSTAPATGLDLTVWYK